MKSLTLSPLIRKDILTLLRTQKAFWLLWVCVLICGAVMIGSYMGFSGVTSMGQRAAIGKSLFYKLAYTLLILMGLSSAVIPSISITSERENRTLDMLTASGLSRLGIVLGKWFSSLAYQFVVLIALMPPLLAVLSLGGVGPDEYLGVALLVGTTVITYSLVGLAISAWMRRSTASLMLTLFTILFLNLLFINIIEFMADLFVKRGVPNFALTWVYGFALEFSPQVIMKFREMGYTTLGGGQPNSATALSYFPNLLHHLIFQYALAGLALFLAWRGLVAGRSQATQTAKKPLDDQAKLDQRRKQFPFYLVDPLRRAEQIRDNQNPLYVKEIRSGAVSRLHVLIRLGYFVCLGSFLLLWPMINAKDVEDVAKCLCNVLVLVAFFTPILAASGVGKEFEEQTIDLLSVTPLTAWQIVFAKFRVALRFVFFLFVAALIVPFFMGISLRSIDYPTMRFLADFTVIWADLSFFLGLCVALGILCSAVCRRTLIAILLHYALLFALFVIPFKLNEYITENTSRQSATNLLICKLLQPLNPYNFFVPGIINPPGQIYHVGPVGLLLHLGFLAVATCLVVRWAGLKLEQRLRRG